MTYEELFDYFPTGRETAISAKAAAELLHCSKRELRQLVTDLRLHGFIICSDVNGYYQPETGEELAAFYRAEISRLKTASKILKPVREKLERMGYNFLNDSFKTDRQITFDMEVEKVET